MKNFGLKLWSKDCANNIELVTHAEKALKEGVFDFLELFPLPDSFNDTKDIIKSRFNGIKTVIHAPHNGQGLNTADKNEFENNCFRIKSSQQFADLLDSDIIILHPGEGHGEEYLEESIRQFKAFNDNRITVENMPAYCNDMLVDLHGSKPSEIKRFIDELGIKFCFDFSHATCSANYFKQDLYKTLKEFAELKPAMYHLCDGDVTSTDDSHWHFGEGTYNLKRLVNEFTAENALITMETGHGAPIDISPWLKDINHIRNLIKD
jgi:endonuclease IV